MWSKALLICTIDQGLNAKFQSIFYWISIAQL